MEGKISLEDFRRFNEFLDHLDEMETAMRMLAGTRGLTHWLLLFCWIEVCLIGSAGAAGPSWGSASPSA